MNTLAENNMEEFKEKNILKSISYNVQEESFSWFNTDSATVIIS